MKLHFAILLGVALYLQVALAIAAPLVAAIDHCEPNPKKDGEFGAGAVEDNRRFPIRFRYQLANSGDDAEDAIDDTGRVEACLAFSNGTSSQYTCPGDPDDDCCLGLLPDFDCCPDDPAVCDPDVHPACDPGAWILYDSSDPDLGDPDLEPTAGDVEAERTLSPFDLPTGYGNPDDEGRFVFLRVTDSVGDVQAADESFA